MLLLLSPFHSFAVVTAVQHLMGLAAGVMLYVLLRRYGLPAWGATLAAVPVLFDAYQIELEHEILPSASFGFLVMVAITLTLWWRGERPLWATVTAGAILAGRGCHPVAGRPAHVHHVPAVPGRAPGRLAGVRDHRGPPAWSRSAGTCSGSTAPTATSASATATASTCGRPRR